MRNILYRVVEDEFVAFIGEEKVCDDIREISNDDLLLISVDNGYLSFYNELDMLRAGETEFNTGKKHYVYSYSSQCGYRLLQETVRLTSCKVLRLSPFSGDSEVSVSGNIGLFDITNAYQRNIMISSKKGSVVHDIKTTKGMYLTIRVVGSVVLKIGSSDMVSRCKWFEAVTYGTDAYVEFDELNCNRPVHFSGTVNFKIGALRVRYSSGRFSMMNIAEFGVRNVSTFYLNCEGYADIADWLVDILENKNERNYNIYDMNENFVKCLRDGFEWQYEDGTNDYLGVICNIKCDSGSMENVYIKYFEGYRHYTKIGRHTIGISYNRQAGCIIIQ